MTDLDLKKLVLDQGKNLIQNRYDQIREELGFLQDSANADTKSSAGDKHETGRAQVMLEKEKLARQLDDIHNHQKVFSSLTDEIKSVVNLGALVCTNHGNYLISSALGEIKNDHFSCFAISPNAPLAKAISGYHVGDEIQFQTRKFKITKIL